MSAVPPTVQVQVTEATALQIAWSAVIVIVSLADRSLKGVKVNAMFVGVWVSLYVPGLTATLQLDTEAITVVQPVMLVIARVSSVDSMLNVTVVPEVRCAAMLLVHVNTKAVPPDTVCDAATVATSILVDVAENPEN